jgi:hypothetical protein
MPMRRAVLLAVIGVMATTSACGRFNINLRNPLQIGSGAETTLPYRANLRAATNGDVTVSVRAQGASLAEVRESARYPVTRHCIERFGNSAADWETDPATGDWAYALDASGTMTLRARCRT